MKKGKSRYKLLILLVLTDFFFIGLHILYTYTNILPNRFFSVDMDMGYPEIFQYIKEYWIGLMLIWLAIKGRSFLFFGWALLFFFLLFDDSMMFHEQNGYILARHFDLQPTLGFRAQDIGELGIMLVVGIFFLAVIGVSHYFSEQRIKEISKRLAILLAALMFFGIYFDAFHSLLIYTGAHKPLALIEDGGEMVVMSLIAWYVFTIDLVSIARVSRY